MTLYELDSFCADHNCEAIIKGDEMVAMIYRGGELIDVFSLFDAISY